MSELSLIKIFLAFVGKKKKKLHRNIVGNAY